MKKTPLQQLIEYLNHESSHYGREDHIQDRMYKQGLEDAIEKATELLEEEKDGIVEACDHNKGVNGWSDGLEYYKETYQNK